jgi:aromatic ring-opening dioxygenase catalytic subunit (LigB family)
MMNTTQLQPVFLLSYSASIFTANPVKELMSWHYEVPGEPELAVEIVKILQGVGQDAKVDPHRGIDHGAWLVSSSFFPQALKIPTLHLSLQASLDPAAHLDAGRALSRLRSEAVLIKS